MPTDQPLQIYGFHPNADITRDIKDTNEICSELLLMNGGNLSKSDEKELETNLNLYL